MIERWQPIAGIPRTAAGTIYDFPASHGCGPHRIFVFIPAAPTPHDGWPLLTLTDGNAVFDLALGMMRVGALDERGSNVGEGIVVAIGYPTERLYDQPGRCWDLTPPPGRIYPDTRGHEIRTGGAEHFLTFVEQALLPWLQALVPINFRRTTMFGHSFGGLFTLFALYRRPQLFRTYVAACPSLYWEEQVITPFEDLFFANQEAQIEVQVLLSAGEWEGPELAPHLRGGPDETELREKLKAIAKVERAEALLRRFESSYVSATLEIFSGESHMTALPVALNRAVQTAFSR